MNKAQKEIIQHNLKKEKEVLDDLKETLRQASKDCERKIAELKNREKMEPEYIQSIIYQKQYQEAIKSQLDNSLKNLDRNVYATVNDYLNQSYKDGYIGVMYDLKHQGIPITMPIDQMQVRKAVELDSKISKGLYNRLGENVDALKKSITREVSRGIANGSSWSDVAKHIANGMNNPFNQMINNTMRIARTEGHRINQAAQLDAQIEAKERGADIVKQWCATLDGATRETHQELDGQIREIDEPFEVEGMEAMYPGDFGDPAEDINCRCTLLERARWALGQSELEKLQKRAEYFGLDKTNSFTEFREKYLSNIESPNIQEQQNI